MANRRGQREALDAATIAHLQAQDAAAAEQSRQDAMRTAILQQQQGTAAAAQRATEAEATAKTARETELTPFQKLLTLSQAGQPEMVDKANRIKAAIDLYQTQQQSRTASQQMQTQRDIEAGRESGAMARQKEQGKSNITDAMITHLATRPDVVDPAVFREALKQQGHPELADAYAKVREPLIQSQVESNKVGLQAAHKTGKLDAALQGITDPDVKSRLQPFVDELRKTAAAPAAPAGNPDYPGYGGAISNAIKYAPIDLQNFAAAGENMTAVPFMNVLNSLVGAPPVKKVPILPRDYSEALKVINQQ